jgi:tRNA pseudouridine55 synthase
MPVDGVLNIDKPGGITSHDVVARVRRLLGQRRVGHAGTLDPMATGVLPVCLGKATRLTEAIQAGRKEYMAEVTFGTATDSQDSTGQVTARRNASHLTEQDVREALRSFVGAIWQVPPMTSARRHEGRRLYSIAREGVEVPREPRQVWIYAASLDAFAPGEQPKAILTIACSSGTYIRTLAHDLGAALGVGAHMSALRRTMVGPFRHEDAAPLHRLEAAGRDVAAAAVLPMTAAVAHLPTVTLPNEELGSVAHGTPPTRWSGSPGDGALPVALLSDAGDLVALAKFVRAKGGSDGCVLRPYAVFLEPEAYADIR